MAEILPIRRKILFKPSINQSLRKAGSKFPNSFSKRSARACFDLQLIDNGLITRGQQWGRRNTFA